MRPRRQTGLALSILFALVSALAACSDNGDDGDNPGNGDGPGDGDAADGDGQNNGDGGNGDGGTGDGPAGCNPSGPQCNNCIDDDNDGQVDGFDIECTSALDNDESSFATGIPGDNMDTVNQDCFFDGDSGAGNDGCNIHVCCLLGAPDQASCPFGAQQYDPAECDDAQSQQCQEVCGSLTPPGCDCFGCCTICDPVTNECFDIITNPATAPNCDATTISDPNACPRCTKVTDCGTPCEPTGCILCPGQTEEDLPPECTMAECPKGQQVCSTEIACPTGQFCTNGCCIDGIP
jgi:hypothetical protein